MKMNTNYFLACLLSISLLNAQEPDSTPSTFGDIRSAAHEWVVTYAKPLNADSVNLLCNLMYYDLLTSIFDAKARATYIAITRKLPQIRRGAQFYNANEYEAYNTLAQQVVVLKKGILPLREKMFTIWCHCNEEIQKSSDEGLNRAVQALQIYGQAVIRCALELHKPDFDKQLSDVNSNVDRLLEEMRLEGATLRAIGDGNNPARSALSENAIVEDVDATLKSADSIITRLQQAQLHMTNIEDVGTSLLELNSLLFGEFYQALYQAGRDGELSTSEFTQLFDEHGSTPEQRTMLPSVEEGFSISFDA